MKSKFIQFKSWQCNAAQCQRAASWSTSLHSYSLLFSSLLFLLSEHCIMLQIYCPAPPCPVRCLVYLSCRIARSEDDSKRVCPTIEINLLIKSTSIRTSARRISAMTTYLLMRWSRHVTIALESVQSKRRTITKL